MGGDDLGSDDEYFVAPVRGIMDDDDDDNGSSVDANQAKETLEGRIRRRSENHGEESYADDDDDGIHQEPSKKKQKKTKTKRGGDGGQKLKSIGHRVVEESAEQQAEFLSEFIGEPFTTQNIAAQRPDQQQKQQQQPKDDEEDGFSFSAAERLVSFISKKQLKKPQQGPKLPSPRVLILAISARRAVAILKELAPLRIQIAKLFPKQGTCHEQATQLSETKFCVAVGTPQRIKELMDRGSLSVKQTQLVLLDTFQNDKRFSVYTLPDTSTYCVDVLKDYVRPECDQRPKRIKVGFL